MPKPVLPDSSAAYILDLQRRLTALEVAPGQPQNLPWRPARSGAVLPWIYFTDASYFTVFDATFTMITADAVVVETAISAPVGTELDVKLHHVGLNLDTDVAHHVGDGLVHTQRFAWEPGWEDYIGFYGTTVVNLQARRTSGAGSCGVYWPWGFTAPTDEVDATSGGV
jgi:hypothetical protein